MVDSRREADFTAERCLRLAVAIAEGDAAASAAAAALDTDQLAGVRREAPLALSVPPHPIQDVLDAVLLGPEPAAGLRWLERSGLLAVLLPEVAALVGFHVGSAVHHKDLWLHTLEVIERMPPDADLRWAALLHDIGKVATRGVDGRGRATFHHHERVGAVWTLGLGARLGLSEARTARIAWVLEHHGRINAYDPAWSDRAVRRLVREAGDGLQDLLAFSSADFTTRRPRKAARIRRNLEHLQTRIIALADAEVAQERSALPRGTGDHICRALQLDPMAGDGPALGAHLDWLRAQVAAGLLPADASPEVYVAAVLAGGA